MNVGLCRKQQRMFEPLELQAVVGCLVWVLGKQILEPDSLCSLGWPRTHYVDQIGLKLQEICLPLLLPHTFWDYRYETLCDTNLSLIPSCLLSSYQRVREGESLT